jgi:formylglycine-generating enzyme required for sulfatase activity
MTEKSVLLRRPSSAQAGRQNVAAVEAMYQFVLWLVLILAFSISPAHAERRVALIIGNSAYAESPLKNPVNDARDMREQLQRLGFGKGDIIYRENLKRDDIGPMLREWRNRLAAGPDTVALVFYAGHGVQIRGENFFPAVDARIDGEEDVPRQAVKLAELLSVMTESRTRVNLVFLDACRNNPYERGFRDGTRGLAPAKPATGTLIAYATEPGAVASDGSGKNGVFTATLLANMTTPGQTVEMMLKQVSEDVYTATQGKQSPWQEGSIRGYFYFSPGNPNQAPGSVSTRPRPGQTIKDCDICPELVALPRGSFMMGSSQTEPEHTEREGPVHRVTINYDLAVGKYEITQGQWKAVMDKNPSRFKDCGDNCPVEGLTWSDAQEYLKKLNARSGQRYRLLSEAEWEYAARAGTTTPFHTGQTITTDQANFDGNRTYNGSIKGIYRSRTMAVGSFAPNAFGLHDMQGNVWEWVQDEWHGNYSGAPENGRAWENSWDGSRRVLRGGSGGNDPGELRSANRDWSTPDFRVSDIGFRIARTY